MKNLDAIVAMYIKLRNHKAKLKKKHSAELLPIDAKMDQIEAALMNHFNKAGVLSVKTAHGTPYITTRTSYKMADRGTFIKFLASSEAYEFITNTVSKPAVVNYVEEHEDLPPGLIQSVERVINVKGASS